MRNRFMNENSRFNLLYYRLKVLLSMLLIMGIAVSCDDDDKKDNNNPQNESVKMKVDGVDWSATVDMMGSWENKLVGIAGQNDKMSRIQFQVMAEGPGTYYIGSNAHDNSMAIYLEGGNTWFASNLHGDGVVAFTKLDVSGAAGVFNFTLYPTVDPENGQSRTISEGTFDVKFE